MATLTSSKVLAPIGTAGKLFAFALDVGRNLFKRPFQTREFLQQAWFIASVTIIPTALVAIPFGSRSPDPRRCWRWSASRGRSPSPS